MADEVLFETKAGVARMTINRPAARNAVTGEMLREMAGFAQSVARDPDIRALLITGRGDHFMAGGDVKGFEGVLDLSPAALRADFEQRSKDAAPLWIALDRMPQPVVVAVRGYSAGAALSFIAGADLVIASETARFVLAHVGLGLVADAATTYHLPRAIGLRRAKQMAYLGDRIDAAEALTIGLVNWVVPDAELEARTEALLDRLAAGPAVSIAAAKRLLNASLAADLERQISAEGRAVGDCAASEDLREGVSAFLEKRQPAFKGR